MPDPFPVCCSDTPVAKRRKILGLQQQSPSPALTNITDGLNSNSGLGITRTSLPELRDDQSSLVSPMELLSTTRTISSPDMEETPLG